MNLYRKAIDALDWGEARNMAKEGAAIAIGHKTPDGDSVMSALAYAYLMVELGYNVVAKMAGPANRETVFAAKAFGFQLPHVLTSVANLEKPRLILMDHSDYAQAVEGARDARILQVVDHHGIGDIAESKLLYGRYMPVGSTCSIVYICFKELEVKVVPEVARILLAGIMSDTLNLVKATCTDVDFFIYKELVDLLAIADGISLEEEFAKVQHIYKGMSLAAKNFEGMTDEEIFNSDAKDYEMGGNRFCVGSLDWNDETTIDGFNQRMIAVMNQLVRNSSSSEKPYNMSFCRVGFKETSYILYNENPNAQIKAEAAFGKSLRQGVIFCERRLSRKLDVVPMLSKVFCG